MSHAKLDLAAIRMPWLNREFLLRASFVALFVLLTYQFPWRWLRFVTSAAVLRISSSLGMATARVSFDTIRIQGQLFRVVIACTFVDVFMGSIPLLWDVRKSLLRNASRLLAVAVIFFGLNLVRLEIAQDRKSTRLNFSHLGISYAVFCLKKKIKQMTA